MALQARGRGTSVFTPAMTAAVLPSDVSVKQCFRFFFDAPYRTVGPLSTTPFCCGSNENLSSSIVAFLEGKSENHFKRHSCVASRAQKIYKHSLRFGLKIAFKPEKKMNAAQKFQAACEGSGYWQRRKFRYGCLPYLGLIQLSSWWPKKSSSAPSCYKALVSSYLEYCPFTLH